MDPTYPLVPTANFVAFFLVLLSMNRAMFQSCNIGLCVFALSVAVVSFYTGVNTVIWANNVQNVATVWCDITSHIDIWSFMALPCCSLAITRRLSNIVRFKDLGKGDRQRQLDVIFDITICVGLPTVVTAIYYVMQSNRFQIIEELGCVNVATDSGLTILLLDGIPILMPLVSLVFYSPRIIWAVYKNRKELEAVLASNAHIDRQGYYRLFGLGLFDLLVTLPNSVLSFDIDLLEDKKENKWPAFWPGWKEIHQDFSSIPVATTDSWSTHGFWCIFFVKWSEWINPLYAIVFFALFGLSPLSRERYCKAFWAICRLFRKQTCNEATVSEIAFQSNQHTTATLIMSSASRHSLTTLTLSVDVESDKAKHNENVYSLHSGDGICSV